ncbi:hypothetical protein AMTRI_Chr11g102140 [Amborella trichopoda]
MASSSTFINGALATGCTFTRKGNPRIVSTSGKSFQSKSFILRIRAEAMATEKLGVKVQKNPPESKLAELGVRKWPKWGCPPSKFPWSYEAKETCYLLEGKVKVFPDGAKEFVEIEAGDLVEFPKGMKCTWDVSLAVDKHYNFD